MAGKKKILVVEDHSEIRRLLVFFLKQMGYDAIEAATGMAGLTQASATLPDLITMDLGLPDIRGVEVTARLKADPATKHIPVIVITAYYGDEQLLESAVDAGASEVLYKPVSLRVLEDSLRRYLAAESHEELLQQGNSQQS
jgi:two-component system cell cycle response regulator DivK